MIKKIIKRIFESRDEKELRLIKGKLRNTECKYKVFLEDAKKLDKKVAVVTGGSGAIGSAICFKLAAEGAIVIVCGRNEENLNSVHNQIKNIKGSESDILQLDVSNYQSIKTGFKNIIEKYGKIDILVNVAGGSARSKAAEIVDEDVDVIENVINSNLLGTILCCKEAASYMKKKKYGRIVNIGSTVGVGGLRKFSDYCAAKSGIIGFTKSLAMELAQDNITVNCVTPGITNQIIWDKPLESFDSNKTYIGKIGKTDDIANAVEFFCRDESSYIIGQNLIVDGGRSLGLKEK